MCPSGSTKQIGVSLLAATLSLTTPLFLPTRAYSQGESPQKAEEEASDYSRITTVPRGEVDAWLKQQIRASGADPARGRYRFVLGFSTSHYAADPVQALATRRIAFGLLNNSLAAGDSVTPVAWEMAVLETKPEVTLTGEPASRDAVVSTFPYTPAPNTAGGHDTERALYDILTGAVTTQNAPATIVLLFTNSGQSQIGPNSTARLFGQANPKLLERFSSLGYRSPERTAFTTRGAATGGSIGNIPVHVIGLFPKQLKSLPGAEASKPRYPTFAFESWRPSGDRPTSVSDLPNPAVSAPVVPAKPSKPVDLTPYLLAGGALVGGTLILWLASKARSGQKPVGKKQPAAAKSSEAKPAGKAIPGSLTVTLKIGGKEEKLTSLRSSRSWVVETATVPGASSSPEAALREVDKPATGAETKSPVATLAFEQIPGRNGWLLVCSAATGYHFTKILEKDVDKTNHHRLLVSPGGDFRATLVHASDSAAAPLTLKVRYDAA